MYITQVRGYVSDSDHDGKTTGVSVIDQVETLSDTVMTFTPYFVEIIPTNISGTGTPPIINVGTNSPNYDNIINGKQLNNLTELLALSLSSAPEIAEGVDLKVKVVSAALLYSCFDFKVVILGNEQYS